jgi:hypothetical protein
VLLSSRFPACGSNLDNKNDAVDTCAVGQFGKDAGYSLYLQKEETLSLSAAPANTDWKPVHLKPSSIFMKRQQALNADFLKIVGVGRRAAAVAVKVRCQRLSSARGKVRRSCAVLTQMFVVL